MATADLLTMDSKKNADKQKALDSALAQIERQFGKGSVMRMGDRDTTNIPSISSGSLSLDIALGIGGVRPPRRGAAGGPARLGVGNYCVMDSLAQVFDGAPRACVDPGAERRAEGATGEVRRLCGIRGAGIVPTAAAWIWAIAELRPGRPQTGPRRARHRWAKRRGRRWPLLAGRRVRLGRALEQYRLRGCVGREPHRAPPVARHRR